jgi:hypothetical protein
MSDLSCTRQLMLHIKWKQLRWSGPREEPFRLPLCISPS